MFDSVGVGGPYINPVSDENHRIANLTLRWFELCFKPRYRM